MSSRNFILSSDIHKRGHASRCKILFGTLTRTISFQCTAGRTLFAFASTRGVSLPDATIFPQTTATCCPPYFLILMVGILGKVVFMFNQRLSQGQRSINEPYVECLQPLTSFECREMPCARRGGVCP